MAENEKLNNAAVNSGDGFAKTIGYDTSSSYRVWKP